MSQFTGIPGEKRLTGIWKAVCIVFADGKVHQGEKEALARLVKGVFLHGVVVNGRASFVSGNPSYYSPDRLSFAYQYLGKWYHRKKWLFWGIPNLVNGGKVGIVLDPKKPKRAFIQDLYW